VPSAPNPLSSRHSRDCHTPPTSCPNRFQQTLPGHHPSSQVSPRISPSSVGSSDRREDSSCNPRATSCEAASVGARRGQRQSRHHDRPSDGRSAWSSRSPSSDPTSGNLDRRPPLVVQPRAKARHDQPTHQRLVRHTRRAIARTPLERAYVASLRDRASRPSTRSHSGLRSAATGCRASCGR
jgi:hypothetical protein